MKKLHTSAVCDPSGRLNTAEQELINIFKAVEVSGNRIGIMKEEQMKIAESLADRGYLNRGKTFGLYTLNFGDSNVT